MIVVLILANLQNYVDHVPQKNVKRKVDNRPTYDMLVVDVTEFGYSATGRKYGVSDTTIRKWLQM